MPERPTDKQTSVESEMSVVNLLERLRSSGNADTCSPNSSGFYLLAAADEDVPAKFLVASRGGKDVRQIIPSIKAKKTNQPSCIVRGQGSGFDLSFSVL